MTSPDARAALEQINHNRHPTALNLHLTKTRLNDASCLCEISAGTFSTVANRAQVLHSIVAVTLTIGRCLEGEQGGIGLDARRMSTSTSACYGFAAHNPRKSSGQPASRHFFGSAAVAALVVGCAWTVYANIFAGSVYPSLSNSSFDAPVIRRPSTFAERNPFSAANNTVVVESAPKVAARVTPAPGPLLSFEDRFAAAAPQGVAPAPAPQVASQAPPNRQVAALAPPERQVADNVPKPCAAARRGEAGEELWRFDPRHGAARQGGGDDGVGGAAGAR